MATSKTSDSGSGRNSQLRKKAEDFLRERAIDPHNVPLDVQELLHELDVHQIELQMQNEALRHAQAEIEVTRDRYSELYNFAPVGYLTINVQGEILEANFTFARMLGMDLIKLQGQRLSRHIVGGDSDPYYSHIKTLIETRKPHQCELLMVRRPASSVGGPPHQNYTNAKTTEGQLLGYFWARLDSAPVFQDDGTVVEYRMVVTDITDRKRAEDVLRANQIQLRLMLEQRNRELEILLRASQKMTNQIEPDDLLESV